MNRVRALAVRIARTFRRDRRTLGLLVITPLTVMILIGYMVGDSGKEPLRLGVLSSGAERPIVTALGQMPQIEIVLLDGDLEGAVGRGEIDAALLNSVERTSTQGFGTPRCDAGNCQPIVVVPGVDVQVESPIVQAIARAQAISEGAALGPGDAPGIVVERVSLDENVRPSTISYAAPAMITVFAFLFTFMLTSVSFLRERQSGTLERLLASPIHTREILGGYMLGFLPFAMLQTLIVLGYATLVLHAQVSGPAWLVFAVLILLVLGVVNLGIALSFEARNELQVIQFIPLVLLPQVFLSGLFWPVRTLWPPLQWLSKLFPMTYAVRALREVMLAGGGLASITAELAALAIFALAMMGFGVAALRRLRA
jgi:ABC-2 type transport system permease protein